jgi:integrase
MARRGRGTGNYRKRGKTSYQLTVWDADNGRQHYRTTRARNDTQAARALKRFQAEVDEGRVAVSKLRPTVADVCTEWLAHKMRVSPDLAEGTVENYERAIAHIVREWGDRKVSTITNGTHVEELYGALAERLAPKTIQNIAGVLFSVLRYAQRREYVWINACTLVEIRPKVNAKPVNAPSDRDLEALMEAMEAYDRRHFVNLVLTASLGARRGEAAGVRRCDVSLDAGTVRLCRNVTKLRRRGQGGRTVVKDTMKTGAGVRTVAVGPAVIALLREHIDELDEIARLHELDAYPDEGYIFSPDLLGRRPYHPDSVNKRIRAVARRNGIATVSPHALRHYAATRIAPHLPASEMMGRFGWKTESMVRRYADYQRARDAEAGAIMDGALANVVPLRRRPVTAAASGD